LVTAVTICTYSIVDGIGARLSANPNAYSAWLFVGIAIVLLPYAWIRGGAGTLAAATPYWRQGLAGGAMQVLSYGIAIWAMTVAPIAVVAALRETSVLFGAAIAVIVLKEPLRTARLVAAALIVTGLVLIRLQ
jgi:drug/metabolite transporter (DMT)-like permease